MSKYLGRRREMTVRLPMELHDQIDAIVRDRRIKQQWVIQEAVEDWLKRITTTVDPIASDPEMTDIEKHLSTTQRRLLRQFAKMISDRERYFVPIIEVTIDQATAAYRSRDISMGDPDPDQGEKIERGEMADHRLGKNPERRKRRAES